MSLLGRWFVRVEADTTKATANVRKFKGEVDTASKSVAKSIRGATEPSRNELQRTTRSFDQLSGAIEKTGGRAGLLLSRTTLLAGAFVQGARMGRNLGQAVGVNYSEWDHLVGNIKNYTGTIVNHVGDLQAAAFKLGTFDWKGIAADIRAAQQDLLGPLSTKNPIRDRGQNPDQREANRVMELANVQRAQRIVQLDLEHAKQLKNAAAVAQLTARLADLVAQELVLNKESGPYVAAVTARTLRNEQYALSADLAAASLERWAAVEADFAAAVRQGRGWTPSFEAMKPLDARQNEDFAAAFQSGINKFASVDLTPAKTVFAQLADEYRKNALTMKDVYQAATKSVEGLFSDVLYAGITGNLDKIDDAFKAFLKDLTRQISQFLAQQAVMRLFGVNTLPTSGAPSIWTAANIVPGAAATPTKSGAISLSSGLVKSPMGSIPSMSSSIPAASRELVMPQTIVVVTDPSQYRTSPNEIITVVQGDIARGGPIHQTIRHKIRR